MSDTGDADCLIQVCCGVSGPGCTTQACNRNDDPYCLKRFLPSLYLLIR